MRKYVLGTKKEEQERLHLQRKVYGKLPIKFSSTDTICEIGFDRYCCRAMFLGQVDLIDEAARFKKF